MSHTPEDDAGVIVLTQVSEPSRQEKAPPKDPPVEHLSHGPPHTLDGVTPDALVDSPTQGGEADDEPVLLLAKREPADLSTRQSDPIPPLPEADGDTENAMLVPDLLSPSIGEQDLLFEMGRELGVETTGGHGSPAPHSKAPADLPSLVGVALHSGQGQATPSQPTPSMDDLPWVSTPGSPLASSASIPVALQQHDTDARPPSTEDEDNALLGDLAGSMDDPYKQPFSEPESPDPFQQTTREPPSPPTQENSTISQSDMTLSSMSSASSTSAALAKMPVFTLAPPAPGGGIQMSQSVDSTHVDVDLTDDMFVKGLLDQLAQHCTRATLFVYQAPLLLGYDTTIRDPHTQTALDPDVPIKDVLFPTHLSSVFSQVIQSQEPYIGPLPESSIDRVLMACLGEQLPERLAIYPIVQGGNVVALFTLDSFEQQPFLKNIKQVDSLIQRAHELDYQWHAPDLLGYFEHL